VYEAFICGTEVGVVPVSLIKNGPKEIIPHKPEGEVSKLLLKQLRDIQVY